MTTPPIRVIVADDHEIYRDGLRMMLQKQAGIEWVGEAANGRDLVEIASRLKPCVVLTDIMMPVKDGIEATRHLKRIHPEINIIALSMFNEDNLVVDMLEAGAKGYLLKNSNKKEIIDAVHSVCNEIPYYCKNTSAKLALMISKSKFNPFANNAAIVFSPKEIDIIKYVCLEMTNKEIGEKLFISGRTVEGHRLKIQEKLNVKSATGIVIYAMKNGLFKPV